MKHGLQSQELMNLHLVGGITAHDVWSAVGHPVYQKVMVLIELAARDGSHGCGLVIEEESPRPVAGIIDCVNEAMGIFSRTEVG
jgi:molybdate-binding protein